MILFLYFLFVELLSLFTVFPSSLSIFMIITLKYLSGDLLMAILFILSFGVHSSIFSFCLTLYVFFYILVRSAVSPVLKVSSLM